MEFLEKEHEFKRFQLDKEYTLAKAEEKALNEIALECELSDDKAKAKNAKTEIKDQLNKREVKQEISREVNPYVPSFVPKQEEPTFNARQNPPHPSPDIGTALSHLVNLQTRQTELSSLIIDQQKAVHLPVREPPVISSDSFEYPAFITAFDSIITNNVHTDKDRLFFLEKYTSGSANEAIKGFLATNSDTAYKEARKLLDQRYGNPVIVAENDKSNLRNWRHINDGDSKGLRDFSDFLVRCQEAMKTMKSMAELDSRQILVTLSVKLPSYSGVKWCRFAHEEQAKCQDPIGFKDFVRFVKKEAEVANHPVFSPDALKRERNRATNPSDQRAHGARPRQQNDTHMGQSFLSSATKAKPKETGRSATPPPLMPPYPVCKGNHSAVKCHKLVNTSFVQRFDIFRKKGLCFRCARSSHLSRDCPSKSTCGECGKKHHTLLHTNEPTSKDIKPQPREKIDQDKTQEKRDSLPDTPATTNASSVFLTSHIESAGFTNSKIVPVFVSHHDHPKKEVKVIALLDDASDTTFVTTKVQQALGIKGIETELTFSTMLGKEVISVSRIDGLIAERLDRRAKVELPKTYARDSIPCRENQTSTPEMADRWSHLKKIKDKIPKLDANIKIGLLISCNCPKAIKPKEVITGKSEDPYAVRTLLG